MQVDDESDELTVALSEMFCQEVSFDTLEQKQVGDAQVLVIRMAYLRSNDSGLPTRISQTAVVLDDPELDLPQFALWPHFKGIAGMLLGRLGGMVDIDFADSPQFSQQYQLHGWNEQAVRLLFDRRIRDYLTDHPQWSARGIGRRVVVFEQNQNCPPEKLDSFTEQGLELLALFQRSEEALDELPDLRREATIDDLVASAEKMGGIQAFFIKDELRKRKISTRDLDEFLAQPTPRSGAPRGLRYQVIGENGFLIVLGVVFLIAGIALSVAIMAFAPADDRLFTVPFGIVLALIGALVTFFSVRYRRTRQRLLREGILVSGRVTRVERTNVQVNNAQRYHLHVEYDFQGGSRASVANIYANIEQAKKLAATHQPVRVLVDPKDPQRFCCIDALLIMD